MIISLPATITTFDDIPKLHLEGNHDYGRIEDGRLTARWKLDDLEIVLVWSTGTVEIPDDAPPGRVKLLQDTLARYGQPPGWNAEAQRVLARGRAAVGKKVEDLTPPQQLALLAALLFRSRAIDDDGKVRPLREWIKRVPDE